MIIDLPENKWVFFINPYRFTVCLFNFALFINMFDILISYLNVLYYFEYIY